MLGQPEKYYPRLHSLGLIEAILTDAVTVRESDYPRLHSLGLIEAVPKATTREEIVRIIRGFTASASLKPPRRLCLRRGQRHYPRLHSLGLIEA